MPYAKYRPENLKKYQMVVIKTLKFYHLVVILQTASEFWSHSCFKINAKPKITSIAISTYFLCKSRKENLQSNFLSQSCLKCPRFPLKIREEPDHYTGLALPLSMQHFGLLQPKSLYISPSMSNFYGTGFRFGLFLGRL